MGEKTIMSKLVPTIDSALQSNASIGTAYSVYSDKDAKQIHLLHCYRYIIFTKDTRLCISISSLLSFAKYFCS